MRWRHGIFCTSCRSRRDTDRCGQLLRRRERALALRLGRRLFDIAFLFPGVAAYAPFLWRKLVTAREFPKHVQRRWLPPRAGATVEAAGFAAAEALLAAGLQFALARGRDS